MTEPILEPTEKPWTVWEEAKVIPAEMIRDYQANLTGEQLVEKWGTSIHYVRKILSERGVEWVRPESKANINPLQNTLDSYSLNR